MTKQLLTHIPIFSFTHQFVRDPSDLWDFVRAESESYLSEVVIHVVVVVQLDDQDQLPEERHSERSQIGKQLMWHAAYKQWDDTSEHKLLICWKIHNILIRNVIKRETYSASSYLNLQFRLLSVTMNSCSWYRYSLLLSACNSCNNTMHKTSLSYRALPVYKWIWLWIKWKKCTAAKECSPVLGLSFVINTKQYCE